MAKVVSLNDRKSEDHAEVEFVKLLDTEVNKEGGVVPLSGKLMSRVHALKSRAKQIEADRELLEG